MTKRTGWMGAFLLALLILGGGCHDRRRGRGSRLCATCPGHDAGRAAQRDTGTWLRDAGDEDGGGYWPADAGPEDAGWSGDAGWGWDRDASGSGDAGWSGDAGTWWPADAGSDHDAGSAFDDAGWVWDDAGR